MDVKATITSKAFYVPAIAAVAGICVGALAAGGGTPIDEDPDFIAMSAAVVDVTAERDAARDDASAWEETSNDLQVALDGAIADTSAAQTIAEEATEAVAAADKTMKDAVDAVDEEWRAKVSALEDQVVDAQATRARVVELETQLDDAREQAVATATDLSSETPPATGNDERFPYCKDLPSGYGPYVQGQDPEYDWYSDRDGDGVVCE